MNKKVIIGILTASMSVGTVFSACVSAETGKAYTKKQVMTYDQDDTKQTELTCMFREDMPNVPYVDMEQYIDLVYNEDSDYTLTGEGNQYTVVGKNRNTGQTGSVLTIDTAKDTLTYEKYNEFVVGKKDGTIVDYVKMSLVPEDEEPVTVYDLSGYDIDLYAEDGHVYIPLSTWSDILSESLTFSDYIDGTIYMTRANASSTDPTPYVQDKEKSYFETVTREADVAGYAYNELRFMLENLYGRPGQVQSKEFLDKLATQGLDATLEEGGTMNDIDLKLMKQYLTSTNLAEYGQGLIMLDNLLFDGGHSFFSVKFFMNLISDENRDQTAFAREYQKLFGEDQAATNAYMNVGKLNSIKQQLNMQLSELRTKGFGEPVKSWESGDESVNISLYIMDKTAVFRFDRFVDDVIITKAGAKPLNEALETAKENNCENFIIDLSTNGGGSDQTMGFLLSMIYDGDVYGYHCDANTGAHKKELYEADKNLDGVIDEKDEEIKYDFNYAIMISGHSFSCGNTTPCLAHELGIPLLGATSGGGGCNVSMLGLPGESGIYQCSSAKVMTNSKYESIDGGIAPDVEMITEAEDGSITATLYDPKELAAAVKEYYEASSITEQNDAGDDLLSSAKALLDEGQYEEAIPLLQKAADMGDAEGQTLLAICYNDGQGVPQDYEAAMKYYRLAADQGYPRGLYNIGLLYDLGQGVEQNYEEAVKYYKLAADKGFDKAQYNLGVCYSLGEGVEQDDEEAAKYFQFAADQGHASALYNLGIYYFNGRGVEQDYSEAYHYFSLAAKQGDAAGMFAVGECYYDGNGVDKDLEAAAEWYQKALDAGFEPRDEEEAEHLKALIPDWVPAETEETGTESEAPVSSNSVSDIDSGSISTDEYNAEIKELLESILGYVTDEEGSFESDQARELIGLLFGKYKDGDAANFDKNYSSAAEAFVPIEEAIDLYMLDTSSAYLEEGKETIFSNLIASFDRNDDDTHRVLGNFTIMNFDTDSDCPDDLVVKNGGSSIELMTLIKKEDGSYEVTDCVEQEEGEGFADSVRRMCEDIGTDPDRFYEALELDDLLYICNLHDFMEAHPEYDHIEYMGDMRTLDDLHEIMEEEFVSYLALYAIDATLTDAEAETTEGESEEVSVEAVAS